MTDSVAVFLPGFRFTDATGAVVSGGQAHFYDAGTLSERTVYSTYDLSTTSLGTVVYSRSDGLPVASQGSSTVVGVYTGSTPYKIILKDADGATIWTLDNIKGAVDTSTFLTTGSTSTLDISVVSKTANYTLVAADNGKLINANPSGGNFTLTFTAAATLTDGWNIEIRNASVTTGQVLLASSEAVSYAGSTFTAYALEIGEAMVIRCDGSAFKVASRTPPLMGARGPGIITITDRVTADPGAPTPGARYIVQTGYSSYATHDIIEANGTSFNKYTPPIDCGWVAWVKDENRYYHFEDSAWVLGLEPAATSAVVGMAALATQAIQQTGTDAATIVTPVLQKQSRSAVKAHGRVSSAGALQTSSYNVTSINKTGTGVYVVTLAITMADTNYTCVASGGDAGTIAYAANTSTTTITINTSNSGTGAATDKPFVLYVMGDLA